MKWFLMFIMNSAPIAEFATVEACEAAREKKVASYAQTPQSYDAMRSIIVCVPRGSLS